MKEVLSTRSIELHKEYLREQRLKLSIFEKSYPGIVGLPNSRLGALRLPRREKEQIVALRNRVNAHELFFSSFLETKYNESEIVKRQLGDISYLLNRVYKLCMDSYGGIVYIVVKGKGVFLEHKTEDEEPSNLPVLAIDNCEHTYFLDYGFNKEEFLSRLLPYLALSKIDEFYKIG